mmetsp:Transcript_145494/g.253943  ORF Transcript_145494/g.253943 Transcript_145494/m.253943 type:complete len:98 (-) Transcript_145494:330-623(-)
MAVGERKIQPGTTPVLADKYMLYDPWEIHECPGPLYRDLNTSLHLSFFCSGKTRAQLKLVLGRCGLQSEKNLEDHSLVCSPLVPNPPGWGLAYSAAA